MLQEQNHILGKMKATTLYAVLAKRFGELVAVDIEKGKSFYLREIRRQSPSTRILRVHETAEGGIAEIKLAVTALCQAGGAFLPLPATEESVCVAVQAQIDELEQKLSTADAVGG